MFENIYNISINKKIRIYFNIVSIILLLFALFSIYNNYKVITLNLALLEYIYIFRIVINCFYIILFVSGYFLIFIKKNYNFLISSVSCIGLIFCYEELVTSAYTNAVVFIGLIASVSFFLLSNFKDRLKYIYSVSAIFIFSFISFLQGIKIIPIHQDMIYPHPLDSLMTTFLIFVIFYSFNLYIHLIKNNLIRYSPYFCLKRLCRKQKKIDDKIKEAKAMIYYLSPDIIKAIDYFSNYIKDNENSKNQLEINHFKRHFGFIYQQQKFFMTLFKEKYSKYYKTGYSLLLRKDDRAFHISFEDTEVFIILDRTQYKIIYLLLKKLISDKLNHNITENNKGYIKRDKLQYQIFRNKLSEDTRLSTNLYRIKKIFIDNNIDKNLIETTKGIRTERGSIRLSTSANYFNLKIEW